MGWASKHIDKLREGKIVKFRPHGTSMKGKVESGQLCTVEPTDDRTIIAIGDIVLCKVHGRQFLHLVSAVQGDRVQISNNHGHINGWIGQSGIYGKLISVGEAQKEKT